MQSIIYFYLFKKSGFNNDTKSQVISEGNDKAKERQI